MGFFHESRSDRYIEDTDRFPGWKGELPVPIQDFKNTSDAGGAPASLTIGVGADGKVNFPFSYQRVMCCRWESYCMAPMRVPAVQAGLM